MGLGLNGRVTGTWWVEALHSCTPELKARASQTDCRNEGAEVSKPVIKLRAETAFHGF
jgi:hypothetical protein